MLLKTYLEYAPRRVVGSISSSPSDIVAWGGRTITGALEDIAVWNVRLGQLEFRLGEESKHRRPLVTRLALHNPEDKRGGGTLLAAGCDSYENYYYYYFILL